MSNKTAYRNIIYYVTQFCLSRRHGSASFSGHRAFNVGGEAKVGDLVSLGAAPISEWCISWLREINHDTVDPTYVLESIETGRLCNWTNVDISYLDRDVVEEHPEWQWSDRQFKFNERWHRECKGNGAHMVLPMSAIFGDEFEVTLSTRTRFNIDSIKPTKKFDDWRKVTKKIMSETYCQLIEERNALKG